MTMLSPAATYHAELRQQLDSVRRAIAVQRGLVWLVRGFAAGLVIVLGLVIWAWTRDGVRALPLPLLVALPFVTALLVASGSFLMRHSTRELAQRIDRAARLHERSMTALELGARGEEFPLAIAQMRDAVEHLKRIDLLEAFPLRAPRTELLAAFFVGLIAVIVGLSPNPWLLQQRASNPSITIAREQAQRVQRLADSLQPSDNAEIDALRQLISKGAKTIDARSNEPDAALNALQDLEEQVQQMGAGDDQLSAALAAVASALASNQTTQPLSDAINTGDMHQISQASKDLAQALAGLTPQERAQVGQTLRDAAQRAGRISQSTATQLSTAADALDQAAAAANAGADGGQDGSADGQQGSAAQDAQTASDALNQLSQSASAADARQRAASQLESSRNALERALGRTQSRSGSNSGSSNSSNNRSASNGQGQGADSGSAQSENGSGSQSRAGDQAGSNGDTNGSGAQNDTGGQGNDNGQGGGYSTGGNPNAMNNNGSPSQLDAVMDPQQVPTNGNVSPNESSVNPYTSEAGSGNAQTAPESVQPSYSNKPTQGNDQGSIPLGLRDLVKDYFSSLDQK